MKETLDKLIEKFGVEHELNMLIEEMAELIQALIKYKRYNGGIEERAEVIVEMADVYICFCQLTNILDCQLELSSSVDRKLERLRGRIE